MATLKFYLDKRAQRKDSRMPLKIGLSHKNEYTLINLDVLLLPEQWNEMGTKIINHPNKLFLNNYIKKRFIDIETVILRLSESGDIRIMSIRDIKDSIVKSLSPEEKEEPELSILFADRLRLFANEKDNHRTRELYLCTLNRIEAFTDIRKLTFEDITYNWLKSFDLFLSHTAKSPNARNVHLRNMRAIFNSAIDDELISCYPFRKFKIKGKETPKRSLTIEQLRHFRDYPCEDHQIKYKDIFMLVFYLIGINIVDLCNLTKKSIVNGRLEYYRAKTGKYYSIKLEPEAVEIIEKYKGNKYLLDILDRYKNYKDYAQKLNNNIREIGETRVLKRMIKGKRREIKERNPIYPDITTYWARHSWATIAHKVGISKDTISMALGHEFGCKTTGIYINYDMDQVDEANRKVLDYLKTFE